MAADAATTKLKRKFMVDKYEILVIMGKKIRDKGNATAKAIIEVKTMKATYALKAISTPPFLSCM